MRCLVPLLLLAVLHAVVVGQDAGDDAEAMLQRVNALPEDALEEREELCRAGIELLTPRTDRSVELGLRRRLGQALMEMENYGEAFESLEAAAGLARAEADRSELMFVLYEVATVGAHTGSFQRALEAAHEVFDLATEFHRVDIQIEAQNAIGVVRDRMGDPQGAIEAYTRVLQLVETNGLPHMPVTVLNNLGVLHMNSGELDEAMKYIERARSTAEELGDQAAIAAALANAGDVYFRLERYQDALESHEAALGLRMQLPSAGDIALSQSRIGHVYIELGAPQVAVEYLTTALAVQRRLQQLPDVVATLDRLARAYAAIDRPAEAVENAREGADLAAQLETKGLRVSVLTALAEAYESQGELALALAAEREAFELGLVVNSLESQRVFAAQIAAADASAKSIRAKAEIATLARDRALAEAGALRDRMIRNAAIAGGVLFLVVALVGWGWVLVKRRSAVLLSRSHQMERRLLEAQKLESLGLLAGGVAHDFNNLLTVIRGNTELARIALEGDDRALAPLANIETACTRAVDLAQQMRLYSGNAEIDLAPVDLGSLVSETTELLKSSFPNVGFRVELHDPTRPVPGDRTQLGQVVLNLLTNAAQAIGDGPGTATARVRVLDVSDPAIEATSVSSETVVALEVVDTGAGMDDETRARLFDPFFTTKPAGRGLGLSVVQAIVRRHAGEIRVRSTLGEGTVFVVLLPAAEAPARTPAPAAPKARAERHVPSGRVLVIDDEDSVRHTTGQILEVLGFAPVLASDGATGLDLADTANGVELAILDLVMPGMDGEETLARLRELRPELPVLLISGYDRRGTVQRLTSDPRVQFLRKPFGGDELRSKMGAMLG